VAQERALLDPIVNAADVVIDTSNMGVHVLREVISQRAMDRATPQLSITFASFGFKHGIPGDADFVFDARTLPNPYWEPSLRHLTGKDAPVIRFLEGHTNVAGLIADISQFVRARIPEYRSSNRGYMTVAVGCTGGQHRSVYIVERLAEAFARELPNVTLRHSALLPAGKS
jgi:UPF0042 nucleotide-binding protein